MPGSKMATGRGKDAVIMNSVISGTTPIVSSIQDIMEIDIIGLQLIVENPVRVIAIKDTDHVVASTHTWTFANGAFTSADVGASLKVSGATNSNNNATVTISSVTNSTTIVTNGTQTDETFTDAVTVVITPVVATGVGTWKVEISCDYEDSGVPALNQVQNALTAHWTDITSAFSPTILSPDGSTAANANQFVQATISARKIRFTFTPSAGAGTAFIAHTGHGTQ
jgi:hypothetical protein